MTSVVRFRTGDRVEIWVQNALGERFWLPGTVTDVGPTNSFVRLDHSGKEVRIFNSFIRPLDLIREIALLDGRTERERVDELVARRPGRRESRMVGFDPGRPGDEAGRGPSALERRPHQPW